MRWNRICVFFIIFSNALFSLETIEENFQKHISFSPEGENFIGYLKIEKDRPIDNSTYIYCKMALQEYAKKNVSFVILELNTPGGEVFAAEKISRLLRDFDTQNKIPVVAFIDNWAISAGAMLAYASRFIVITNTSSMGAAEPVYLKNGQMESASEKIKSALRSEFANLASFYGRDPLIAQAMVDSDLLLVWRDNLVVQLSGKEQILTSDRLITEKGKLLTLNAEELMDFQVADRLVKPLVLEPITEQELSEGSWSFSKHPLYGDPFFSKIPHAKILSYQNWRVTFFSFLSHPVMASLLMIGLVIGFYMFIYTHGFGIATWIGLACLALMVLSSASIYTINWLELILFVTGIFLLALEIFVIPGFGVTGILGILFTFVGLFTMMMPSFKNIVFTFDTQHWNLLTFMAFERLAWFCGALVLSVLFILFLSSFLLPKFSRIHPLVLKGGEQEGFLSGPDVTIYPLIHSLGVTVTSLYPFGKIRIDEKIYEAKAERGFLDKGEKIILVRVEGNAMIVRKI